MARIVVAGGSFAGMYAALHLARRGHEVHLVERDAGAPPDDPEVALRDWDRPGTPQLRQSHAFLGRARHELVTYMPDVHAALLDAGVPETRLANHLPPSIPDRTPRPGDDDLVVMSARRTTVDAVLHRATCREPGVTTSWGGGVAGLLFSANGGTPRVTGVALRDGTTLDADAVVDATGRTSRVPRWLADAGLPAPVDEGEPCGNVYYTRYYRLRPGATPPAYMTGFNSFTMGDAYVAIVFRGDGDTFSLSLQTDDDDAPSRALRDERAFTAVAAALPVMAPWLAAGEPTTGVNVMAGLHNRVRRFVANGRPIVTGLFPVGDAACITNPAYGRGTAMSATCARLAGDALDGHAAPEDAASAYAESIDREVVPFYRIARDADRDERGRWRHVLYGEPPPAPPASVEWIHAFFAGFRDRDVWSRTTRVNMLLATPEETLADPLVAALAREVFETRWFPPAPPFPAPSRAELVEVATAAVAS